MSNFSMFMADKAEKIGIVKYVASKRFLDSKGKPVEWELKAINSDLDEAIRKECTKKVSTGKRGQTTPETDTDKYIGKMCVACVVFPDLNDAELQDSYGVKDGMSLLKRMLLPGEYTELKAKIMEVNGYDMSLEEQVDEAKN